MRGVTFATGPHGKHQQAMISWARRRLADRSGGKIVTPESKRFWEQTGALVADGVGMGKTWEALGAAAVILSTKARWRKNGRRRTNLVHELGRVLVITPPNLVDKWSDEIHRQDPGRFHHYLAAWARSHPKRQFILETLSSAGCYRFKRDLPTPRDIDNGGVFIVNHRLVVSDAKNAGLDHIRQAPWDLIIIDEAHHSEARKILRAHRLRCLSPRTKQRAPLILLTATPFELTLKELGALVDHLAHGGGGRLIKSRLVQQYVSAIAGLTPGDQKLSPAIAKSVSELFRQVMARNRSDPRFGVRRRYHFLSENGKTTPGELTADAMVLANQVAAGCIVATPAFESWYLGERLRLKGTTAAGDATCIANGLRQLLSTPGQANGVRRTSLVPYSPRLSALEAWYRREAVTSLTAGLRDGNPRKTLVFTAYVSSAAADLQRSLTTAFEAAVTEVAEKHPAWQAASLRALGRLEQWCSDNMDGRSLQPAHLAISRLRTRANAGRPSATLLMLSKLRYERLLTKELSVAVAGAQKSADDILRGLDVKDPDLVDDRRRDHAQRIITTHRRDLKWILHWLGDPATVARFDGETTGRNRIAFGFQARVGPWAMVASRVGSEGIDLHTWARHLVHFDLEWNPAVMEQREGRCDRIGRKIPEDLDILFLIVRGTYDERMLHQVAVRQQLHRLILGIDRNDVRAAGDLPASMTANLDQLLAMELDLRPRVR